MLDIMKEKEIIVAKIFKNTEEKLEKIFKNEFKEFNVVTVKCFVDHDQLNLEKEGKKVRIHLNSKRYKRKYDKEHNTGLYFFRFK